MNHGDICLVPFPFTDGTGAKVRPVLVVSIDEFNRGDDIVVVPISSRLNPSDLFAINVDHTSPHFAATGLRCASAIKWTKLMAIAKCRILRRLGTMHEDTMLQVSRSIVAMVSF